MKDSGFVENVTDSNFLHNPPSLCVNRSGSLVRDFCTLNLIEYVDRIFPSLLVTQDALITLLNRTHCNFQKGWNETKCESNKAIVVQ